MNDPAELNPETVISESQSNQTIKVEAARGEVSAQTIARMMGLTTQTDLKLVEGKLDLLVSRLGTINVRLERVGQSLQQTPTVNDMERIDVQIGTLRSSMRELLQALKGVVEANPDSKDRLAQAEKELDTLPEGFEQK
jgi:Flp pilus assembly secretin CpaC